MVGLHDTTGAARRAQLAAYRSMTPARRLVIALTMSEEARAVAEAGRRARQRSRLEGRSGS